MVMDTIQIRMSPGLIKVLDKLVATGIYSNRSDAIRDAVRRFIWQTEVGTTKPVGNAVNEIRKVRKELSKSISKKDLEEINKL